MKYKVGLVLVIFLCGCSVNQMLDFYGTPTKKEYQIQINTEQGVFVCKNLFIESDFLSYLSFAHLTGEIVNNTSRNWERVEFEVTLYDKSEKRIKRSSDSDTGLYLSFFKKGETKSIYVSLDRLGYKFEKEQLSELGNWNISFKGGAYPAEYTFAMVEPKESNSMIFEDKSIALNFSGSGFPALDFCLHNNTNSTIAIDDTKILYIDPSGNTHQILPSIDSLIVPSRAKVNGRFNLQLFLPSHIQVASASQESGATSYLGKSFKLLLPLMINETAKNYSFTFKIKKVS